MLRYRAVCGLTLAVALLLAANYLTGPGIWLVLLTVSCLAQLEFYNMLRKAQIPCFRVVGTLCGAALISATYWTVGRDPKMTESLMRWEQIVLTGSLFVMFIRQFPQKHNERPLETIGCTLLGIWYVPFLFNFFTRLVFVWDVGVEHKTAWTGRLLVLYLVIVVKSSDMGAYFTGRLLGRHKLFPRISPGKTWEGLAGGIVWAVLASWLFWLIGHGHVGRLSFGWGDALVLGALLACAGVVGDLFESLLKRAAGVKDSGCMLPGMGGLLDLLDSLLFGAPLLYAYARAFWE